MITICLSSVPYILLFVGYYDPPIPKKGGSIFWRGNYVMNCFHLFNRSRFSFIYNEPQCIASVIALVVKDTAIAY